MFKFKINNDYYHSPNYFTQRYVFLNGLTKKLFTFFIHFNENFFLGVKELRRFFLEVKELRS